MLGSRGSSEPVCVLVIDDDPAVRRVLAAALASLATTPTEICEATTLAGGMTAVREREPAAVIVSLDLAPARDAIEALRRAGMTGPILATSAQGSVATAVEVIRAGANDFVLKPFRPTDLARRLALALANAAPQPHAAPPLAPAEPIETGFAGFIGASPSMRAVYEQITRVAPSKAPLFITGESGTGKEVCAEAVHARSSLARGPFIALNCGAIPRELMESEIFGHVKGAFTGAHEDRPGAAELAQGGTLFLDEICELDLALQAKLLRFLQTGSVRRVGDPKERPVDLRIFCATNRDPAAAVAAGRFRADLFYRLYVLPLHLPPLRQRGDDVLLLARAFLARFGAEEGRAFLGFEPAAEVVLERYSWPGNVRELQNVIRRVVVLHDGAEVSAEMLALPGADAVPAREARTVLARSAIDLFWRQEREIIEIALAAFDGNTQRAAAALGISPSTIYRKRQAWTERRGAA